MKLAIVTQDLVGQGVQYVAAMTARMFVERGWDVDILTTQMHLDLVAQGKKPFEVPAQVGWYYMPSYHARHNIRSLRQYIKTHKVDLMIFESGLYVQAARFAFWGMPKARLPKLVQVEHGNHPPISRRIVKRLRDRLWYWFYYSKFYAVLSVNEESVVNTTERYKKPMGIKVGCVYNPCCDEVFESKVRLSPTHPWLINKQCPTFVCAGAYEPYKDHMTLLRAVKRVKDAGKRIRVIIFGRGSLESTYREYIKGNELEDWASIGGFTDRLPAEMRASDGFVLSSNWESFGIVLVEALASHVPCVATDAEFGPRCILNRGKYGRIVPIADDKEMSDALIDCADGKIPVAPDESWQRFTKDAICQRYFDLLEL